MGIFKKTNKKEAGKRPRIKKQRKEQYIAGARLERSEMADGSVRIRSRLVFPLAEPKNRKPYRLNPDGTVSPLGTHRDDKFDV